MERFKKILKTAFFAVVVIFFISGNYACNQHKCVANGGEQPKKVNKYRNKPQSGLWDKSMKKRRR